MFMLLWQLCAWPWGRLVEGKKREKNSKNSAYTLQHLKGSKCQSYGQKDGACVCVYMFSLSSPAVQFPYLACP